MNSIEIRPEREMSGALKDVFRRIKINTEFSGQGQRSICVTSTASGEGKSTITFALAQAFAEDQGKKVLLVDADIRRSYLSQRLGYDSKLAGLSECITEKLSVVDSIYKTNIDGLFITPSGRLTENSTQLFKRDCFKNYLEMTRKAFDMVIIDTPPIGYVVDAAIIASLADASVMVVAANTVSRKEIKRNLLELKKANENFLGIIFNKAKEEREGYYKYYQYYGGGMIKYVE